MLTYVRHVGRCVMSHVGVDVYAFACARLTGTGWSGQNAGGYRTDSWRSWDDGATWQLLTDTLPFCARDVYGTIIRAGNETVLDSMFLLGGNCGGFRYMSHAREDE